MMCVKTAPALELNIILRFLAKTVLRLREVREREEHVPLSDSVLRTHGSSTAPHQSIAAVAFTATHAGAKQVLCM